MATQTHLINAIKQAPNITPWNVMKTAETYDSSKHHYALRTNSMTRAVRVRPAILEAAALCGVSDISAYPLVKCPFRMIQRNFDDKTEVFVEAKMPDDTSFLVLATDSKVRVSIVETDGSRNPAQPFKGMDTTPLSMIVLALFPHILAVDKAKGNEKLQQAIKDLGSVLDGYSSAPWTDHMDVPDLAKDAVYTLDAALLVMNDHLNLDCGDTRTDEPCELEVNYFANGTISGALLYEYLPDSWVPKVLIANGSASVFSSTNMCIKEARNKYSSFTAHRKWTPQERMMIPQLPEKMPVMPEVLKIADRIVNTKGDINPVCNLMWRGVTGYGKSTGVQQLACILNIPLLTITCHPNMEAQDFRSQFVPEGTTDGLPMNGENYQGPQEQATEGIVLPPYFEEAMTHLQALEPEEKAVIMDAKNFYFMAMMDTDSAVEMLLGETKAIELEALCLLYSEIHASVREQALRKKLADYEKTHNNDTEKTDNKPQFTHVISPYLKAMANGYLIEIQEASRIRDSGVLVSLNEFNRPGAIMHLMDGASVRRHKDALAIITDNVGYASCRPIDPSVIRRQDLIIDSYELTENLVKSRARANTGVTDTALLDLGYKLWNCVKEYCAKNAISEGSVSPVEYERFIQAMKYDGMEALAENLDQCIISKASSSIEDQRDIRTACQVIYSTSPV